VLAPKRTGDARVLGRDEVRVRTVGALGRQSQHGAAQVPPARAASVPAAAWPDTRRRPSRRDTVCTGTMKTLWTRRDAEQVVAT